MSGEPRPSLAYRATTATLQPLVSSEPNGRQNKLPESKSENASEEAGTTPSSPSRIHFLDILWFFSIFVMLVWPWIFFGVVWAKKGIQMNNHMAKVVTDNPHATTYFVTLICSFISMIISALFSIAIIRFAQELVTNRAPTQPFHLRVLLAFRHQTWPLGKRWKDLKYLMAKGRWWPAVLLIVCVTTFPHLISSTTSLLTPAPFNRTAILTGTELDFSSTSADCVAWFETNSPASLVNCDWQVFKGIPFTSCLGENQMVDALEAGRGNIVELVSNNTQSLTFSQLGAQDGLHFLGSIRGVLPIGPNGVPAFDTLGPSPFSNPKTVAAMISYDYTLHHQGLTSNVSCNYGPTTPIKAQPLVPNDNLALRYNASCADQGETEVLTDVGVTGFNSVNSQNLLEYWACQTSPNSTQSPSYSVYLRGIGAYNTSAGNMACSISPIQPAVFPVTYQSTARIFSTQESTSSAPIAFPTIISYILAALGDIVSEGQNFQSNLVAESVITFGVKSFGLPPYLPESQYLQLYEQMIQGILEYHTTYMRLIYATVPNPPSSCTRLVTGSVRYQVVGWFVTSANIGFLIPLTLINLAAFVALSLAVIMAKSGSRILPPSEPRAVTYHEDTDQKDQIPDEWRHKVTFQPTTVLKDYFDSKVKNNLIDGVKSAGELATDEAEQLAEEKQITSAMADAPSIPNPGPIPS